MSKLSSKMLAAFGAAIIGVVVLLISTFTPAGDATKALVYAGASLASLGTVAITLLLLFE
jgi:hypothetical protein